VSKPKTLLEELCEHALCCGADSLDVKYDEGREWVFGRKGDISFSTANFKSTSRNGKQLRENLYAAQKRPVRTAIGGQVWILKVEVNQSFGEDAFRVPLIRRQSSIRRSYRPSPRSRGSIWHLS
jgi:hypothetical protein